MNKALPACAVFLVVMAVCSPRSLAQTTHAVSDPELTYTREISRRAEQVVATLGIADASKSARVQATIAKQYRDLREIHDARDAKIKSARGTTGPTNQAHAQAEMESTQDDANHQLKRLHGEYLSRLAVELSPEQVDQVKDGMTYGVLPLTYGVYLKLYPDLTNEEKRKIKDWLIEARESAMDAGSSQEKHAVFGKYKGRINNYLSAAGYDAKAAERNLRKPSEVDGNQLK